MAKYPGIALGALILPAGCTTIPYEDFHVRPSEAHEAWLAAGNMDGASIIWIHGEESWDTTEPICVDQRFTLNASAGTIRYSSPDTLSRNGEVVVLYEMVDIDRGCHTTSKAYFISAGEKILTSPSFDDRRIAIAGDRFLFGDDVVELGQVGVLEYEIPESTNVDRAKRGTVEGTLKIDNLGPVSPENVFA